MRNSFYEGFIKGCGITAGIAVILCVVWVGYSFFCKDIIDSGLAYFAAKVIAMPASNPNLDSGTLYQATLAYYNQLISILIFVVGIAGVIAFAHIGIISREKAEEIAKISAKNGVIMHIGSKEFDDLITKKVDVFINDGEFSNNGELLENINIRLTDIESKYDRLDEKLQIKHEDQMVEKQN